MAPKKRTVESKIERIASSAKGIVTRQELLQAGISTDEIRQRLETGALLPEYRGVYRVGHRAPNAESSYMAAVKACGDGALLSGLAGAWLVGLVKGRPPTPEVTAPAERRLRGIRTRRSPTVCEADAMRWKGIPVTAVPRILIDLAPRLSEDQLARVCHEAGVLHKVTPGMVERRLKRNTPGAGKLRAVMRGDVKVLLSKLEKRFAERLEEHGLPLPITNKPAGGRRVDCRWPDHKLTVELNSYTFHNSRHSWRQDYKRQREAYDRGDEFRSYTREDVFDQPDQMMRELVELLR